MPEMVTAAWFAFAFLLVALVASLTCLGLRTLHLWRTLRSFSSAATAGLDRVLRTSAAAEEKAAGLSDKQEQLAAARERLNASLARLAVLRAAAAETGAAINRLRGTVPRK